MVVAQPLLSVTVTSYVPPSRPDKSSLEEVNPFGPVHEYVYGPVPPVTVRSIVPSLPEISSVEVPLAESAAGSLIVELAVSVQPLSSVIITVYVPLPSAEISSVVEEEASSQRKVSVPVPPVAVRSIDPSLSPLHVMSVALADPETAAGSLTVELMVSVHPLSSVIITLKVPPLSPEISSVVEEEASSQRKVQEVVLLLLAF